MSTPTNLAIVTVVSLRTLEQILPPGRLPDVVKKVAGGWTFYCTTVPPLADESPEMAALALYLQPPTGALPQTPPVADATAYTGDDQ